MRLRTHVLALAALGAAAITPATGFGSDLGYTYAELRYLSVDGGDAPDADGGTAIGWFRLHENFFLIGQVVRTRNDNDVDATTGALGGGAILPVSDSWDVVAIATARRTKLEADVIDVEEDGYGAQLGLRGMPVPKLEARIFANYVDVVDEDTSVFVSADYWSSPTFAAGVAAEVGGDVDTYSIGIRYSFGN
jgi:hypothetical protein